MRTPPEPDAYARRLAARLQLTRNPKITHDPPGEPRALRVNKVTEVLETASVFSAQCIGATLSTHADL